MVGYKEREGLGSSRLEEFRKESWWVFLWVFLGLIFNGVVCVMREGLCVGFIGDYIMINSIYEVILIFWKGYLK